MQRLARISHATAGAQGALPSGLCPLTAPPTHPSLLLPLLLHPDRTLCGMEGAIGDEQFRRLWDGACDSQSQRVLTKPMLRLPDQLTVGACSNANIVVDVACNPSQDLHLADRGGPCARHHTDRPTVAAIRTNERYVP